MVWVPQKLREYADLIKGGAAPEKYVVREFLGWFGAQRRTYYVVLRIREALRGVGLETDPDFESAYIDAEISIRPVRSPTAADRSSYGTLDAGRSKPLSEGQTAGQYVDPTYRISRLASANHRPLSVPPGAAIGYATTLMIANDYSQLPVMQSDRTVKGMISWRSIGRNVVLGKPCKVVQDCMEDHQEINAATSLLAAISVIAEHDVVLVRSGSGNISGIVTTSDLSLQFGQLTEPFLLIGEIENQLRRLIDRRFAPADLEADRDPVLASSKVTGAADLSFGDYRTLLERPENWDRLGLPLDRKVFIAELERVRGIRNDVMHFDPDGVVDEDLRALRQFAKLFGVLTAAGVA